MDILVSTSIFPSIEYFACHFLASKTFIEHHETYPKQTLRNRYNIATSQGIQSLSIPVIKTQGSNTPICKIEISNATDFQRNHFRAINTAYKSAPFYEYYIDFFNDCIFHKTDSLMEYNTFVFRKICELLKINKEINFTTEYQKIPLNHVDLRNNLSSKSMINQYHYICDIEDYYQVFKEKAGLLKNLSIIDLIFNEGPRAEKIIKSSKIFT